MQPISYRLVAATNEMLFCVEMELTMPFRRLPTGVCPSWLSTICDIALNAPTGNDEHPATFIATGARRTMFEDGDIEY